MTLERLQGFHREWLGNDDVTDLFGFPIADIDLREDEHTVLNRLYYLAFSLSRDGLRYFVFYADNTFQKSENGDLALCSSVYHIL